MRIISSFKDYYDFVVSEPDNRRVYNRDTKQVVYNKEDHEANPDKTFLSALPIGEYQFRRTLYCELHKSTGAFISCVAFCNRLRIYFQYENLIYWNYEDIPEKVIKKLDQPDKWSKWRFKNYDRFEFGRTPFNDMLYHKRLGWVLDYHTQEPKPTNFNKTFQSPVVYFKTPDFENVFINPKLHDIGFNKIVPPTEAFQDIYNWIPYHEGNIPSSPDDMGRYEAKGFDAKTSFRPKIKDN